MLGFGGAAFGLVVSLEGTKSIFVKFSVKTEQATPTPPPWSLFVMPRYGMCSGERERLGLHVGPSNAWQG
jgi:hypothetical protein